MAINLTILPNELLKRCGLPLPKVPFEVLFLHLDNFNKKDPMHRVTHALSEKIYTLHLFSRLCKELNENLQQQKKI